MSLNFRYICRLCLKQNVTLISIFSEENGGSSPTLPVKIKSFAPNLKIFVGDGLPDHVCQQCASQIDSTYKFKLQCESSDATLRQSLLNQTIQISSGDGMPAQVCYKCVYQVETFFNFKAQCEATDVALRQHLKSVQLITESIQNMLVKQETSVKEKLSSVDGCKMSYSFAHLPTRGSVDQ
ncbi:uncharacterized protein [Periplaneta americana]|uniref:uncharacterized protein isoform X3 n=1 Tax=Periplaneta americana TaxID=6978 RepID=UPI0037E7F91D